MNSGKRTYFQFCGIAKALDVVGERWTMLILRDLLMGPRRYTDLLTGLPGITTNLLAKRLKEMEESGLIQKLDLPRPAIGGAYQLTSLGRDLEPALMALGQWGSQYLKEPGKEEVTNIGWGLISLKRRFKGVSKKLVVQLEPDGRLFQYVLTKAYADLSEGSQATPDLQITGNIGAFQALFFRGAAWSDLAAKKLISVSGDDKRLADFLKAFGLAL